MEELEKEIVQEVNERRAEHGSAPLQIKAELKKEAKLLAKRLANLGILRHSRNPRFGENIAMTTKENPSGEE